MGYTTRFKGYFYLDRPLDSKTVEFLRRLAGTRRMKRDVEKLPESGFEKYGLTSWGTDGEFYVESLENSGQNRTSDIVDYNKPPRTQPGLWCQWVPSCSGEKIHWDGNEKFNDYEEWLKYIVEVILKPQAYILNGEVKYQGENIGDHGILRVNNNLVTKDPGGKLEEEPKEEKPFRYPERIPAHYAHAIRQLVWGNDHPMIWEVVKEWVVERGIVKVLQDTALILEFNGLDVAAQAKFLDTHIRKMREED